MPRKPKYEIELEEMLEVVCKFQNRVNFIKSKGINVDQITAALATLGTDIDSLIAKPGGITPEQVQTIVDGITALDQKVKSALTSAA